LWRWKRFLSSRTLTYGEISMPASHAASELIVYSDLSKLPRLYLLVLANQLPMRNVAGTLTSPSTEIRRQEPRGSQTRYWARSCSAGLAPVRFFLEMHRCSIGLAQYCRQGLT
jgi:hypothetical protein